MKLISITLLIHKLSENEENIPIKEDDLSIIDYYNGIFHLINISNYYTTVENINKNIIPLDNSIQ